MSLRYPGRETHPFRLRKLRMNVVSYLGFTRSEYDAIYGVRRLLDLSHYNEPTFRLNLALLLSEDWPELARRVARLTDAEAGILLERLRGAAAVHGGRVEDARRGGYFLSAARPVRPALAAIPHPPPPRRLAGVGAQGGLDEWRGVRLVPRPAAAAFTGEQVVPFRRCCSGAGRARHRPTLHPPARPEPRPPGRTLRGFRKPSNCAPGLCALKDHPGVL